MLLSRDDWVADPRAEDLPSDSAAWTFLLACVYDAEPQPSELFGCLHGVRCLGARLEKADGTARIRAPLKEQAAYEQARAIFVRAVATMSPCLIRTLRHL